MYKWFFTSIILFLMLSSGLGANEVTIQASAPRVLRVGEQFQVSYTVNQNVDDFTPSDFSNFQFLGGPQTGQSTSIQMINGKTTRTSSYTFTYYLRASKAGKFTLESATANYKGDEVRSNTLTIEIIGNTQQQAQTGGGSSAASGNQASSQNVQTSGEDLFVRLIPDKKSVYVGEQLGVTIKLFTKVNISGLGQRSNESFAGFYKQDIEVPQLNQLVRERVGNEIYHTGLLNKAILYPQRSGEIVIQPFTQEVTMRQQVRQSGSVFDEFFGGSYRNVQVELKSKPVKIKVKPLPPNKPKGFSGAVGKFRLSAAVSETTVMTNDAVTFTVTISGTGNIKLLEGLDYEMPPTFDKFDPIVKAKIDNSEGRSGKKIIEITAIPRHAGTYTIKPFKFVYFDPSTDKYQSLQTQSFTIQVNKSDSDTTGVIVTNLSKEDIKLLASDIKFIDTNVKLDKITDFIFGKLWFFLVYIILTILFIAILIIRKEQIKRNADLVSLRNRKANKVASKRLKLAQGFMKRNEQDKFYEEVSRAIWGYLSDKLSIAFAELSENNLRHLLSECKVDTEQTEQLLKLIHDCEFARYAPSSEKPAMDSLMKRAEDIILELERNIQI